MKTKHQALASLLAMGLSATALSAASPAFASSTHVSPSGTLVYVPHVGAEFTRNFNPFSPNEVYGGTSLIYEPLMVFNQLEPQKPPLPWLATSWSFNASGTALTIHVRSGVSWSNGKPLTAKDVAFTLNYLVKNPAANGNGIPITGATVTGPDTVVAHFSHPAFVYLFFLAQVPIVPEAYFAGTNLNFANPNPVGSGPYVLSSFNPQELVFTVNPDFWGPRPHVAKIVMPAYLSNTTADDALAAGTVDATDTFVPDVKKFFVSRNPSLYHIFYPAQSVLVFYLNTTKAPFNNAAVRKALSLTINRLEVDNLGEGGNEPPANAAGLLPSQAGYAAPGISLAPVTPNLSEAAALLRSAGYTQSGGQWTKDGQPLSVDITAPASFTDNVTDDQIMASNLQKAGWHATVTPVATNQAFNNLAVGDFQAMINEPNDGPTPFYFYDQVLAASNSAPIGKPAGPNPERWFQPATQAALAQYANAATNPARQAALDTLEHVMVDLVPSVPLLDAVAFFNYSTRHFTGWPTAQNPYAYPGDSNPTNGEMEQWVLHIQPVR